MYINSGFKNYNSNYNKLVWLEIWGRLIGQSLSVYINRLV